MGINNHDTWHEIGGAWSCEYLHMVNSLTRCSRSLKWSTSEVHCDGELAFHSCWQRPNTEQIYTHSGDIAVQWNPNDLTKQPLIYAFTQACYSYFRAVSMALLNWMECVENGLLSGIWLTFWNTSAKHFCWPVSISWTFKFIDYYRYATIWLH